MGNYPVNRAMRKTSILGLLLLTFCIVCRFFTPVADFYALHLYPLVSGGLSRVSSLFPFSLEELVALFFAGYLLAITGIAIRRRQKFMVWLRKTLVMVLWLFVWAYWGWGNNYYRTGFYERNGIQRISYDEDTFRRFLSDYTCKLNMAAKEAGTYDQDTLEAEAKAFYSNVVSQYGYARLHPWQHVKKPVINRLFSAVGVTGYMGPFFCEAQVNSDVSEGEYPYTMAHELAHLAGVTSEAEASYWGYAFCRQSENSAVRYSGFLSLLPYVFLNARNLLTQEEFNAWTMTLCEEAKEDFIALQTFWKGKRIAWISDTQKWMQNLMLKSNGVSSGVSDYLGVVAIVITMDSHLKSDQRHPSPL